MKTMTIIAVLLAASTAGAFEVPALDFDPATYLCPRALTAPKIDGRLDDPAWQLAPWTSEFVDIEGDAKPHPHLTTRARMTWDDEYFYVAAEMEEPHVWGTLTKRDAVIYHDNDFEVFIDPDGDNHRYYELEINALGTEWDLFLVRPYRDGGPALNAWDITGLKTAVHVDGTLNDPSDTDRGWSVEIAIPWKVLAEAANRPSPPAPGDIWRVNFSRVQWQLEVENGDYVKVPDMPENNWVWSPQGLIAMHYPEMWGEVMFTDGGPHDFDESAEHRTISGAAYLMPVYYAQRQFHEDHGRYARDMNELGLPPTRGFEVQGEADRFLARFTGAHGTATIDETGRLRRLP
jgi:hypothetical protein